MRTVALFAACALAALACQKTEAPPSLPLPFSDDFERPALGPNWFPSGGDWKIRDGYVYTTGANNAPLFLNAVALPTEVVIEVDVMSETGDVDSKIELMTDGRAHQSGYIFIFGGWTNQLSVIARLDEHGDDRQVKKPTGAAGNRWYKWRIEKQGGELRWLVDGQPYMSFRDPKPVGGPGHDRFAFSNWQNRIRFDNLRIWPLASAPPVKTSTAGGANP